MINHVFLSFSAVQICDLSFIYLPTGSYVLTMWPASSWLDRSVGIALHVMGSKILFKPAFLFSGFNITCNCLSCMYSCNGQSYFHIFCTIQIYSVIPIFRTSNWGNRKLVRKRVREIEGKIVAFDRGEGTAFGSSYREVQKIEGLRNRDSIVWTFIYSLVILEQFTSSYLKKH